MIMELIILGSCFMLCCIAIIISIPLIGLYRKRLDIEEIGILLKFDHSKITENITLFLNDFILDCIQDYVLYNITPDSELRYITKDREDKIRDDVKVLVLSRLSPFMLKKITMCYSEDYIHQIIAEKIFSAVTVYVAEFNSSNNKIVEIGRNKKTVPIDSSLDW